MKWPILTSKEKQVAAFVVFCVVLGFATKTYRALHPATPLQDHRRQVEPAPTPRSK